MNTSKTKRLRTAALLVVSSFFLATLLFGIFPNVFQSWDSETIDRLFLLREKLRPSPYDSAIVHIDIDNSSIKKLGYYFPRRLHADLFDITRKMGFSAIGYDIIFASHLEASDDSALLESVHQSGNGYFPVAFELKNKQALPRLEFEEAKYLDSTAWTLQETHTDAFYQSGATLVSWPPLLFQSRGAGFISVHTDADGVFRRVPLIIRYKSKFYPSMVFRLACDQLHVLPGDIIIDGGNAITLRHATSTSGRVNDIVIPIDDQGNMVINWIGPWEQMTHISFATLLETAQDREEVEAFAERYRGSIGIVGDVSTGISDIGPTPFEESYPLVGLQASTLNTILTENFLTQLPLKLIIAIEILIAALMIFFSHKFSSVGFTLASIGLLLVYTIVGCSLFIFDNVITSLIHPSLSILFSTGSVLTYRYITEEKEKEQLRARFESYFPPAVVKQMLENPDSTQTVPKNMDVTVMFSDIKSFTSHSSRLTPEEISRSLSEYFEAMTTIVFKYEGTVDKFIGDGLMVFYGAPEQQPDHAVRCVQSAIEMQKKCRELRTRWESEGRFPLQIRIGINTGNVIVGDLGSERRKEYTVIGSDVNLAQRLESNAPVGGILISESTYHALQNNIPVVRHDPILVKGLDTPVNVYEVVVD